MFFYHYICFLGDFEDFCLIILLLYSYNADYPNSVICTVYSHNNHFSRSKCVTQIVQPVVLILRTISLSQCPKRIRFYAPARFTSETERCSAFNASCAAASSSQSQGIRCTAKSATHFAILVPVKCANDTLQIAARIITTISILLFYYRTIKNSAAKYQRRFLS